MPTNIRYRDGSFSNFNSTDLDGFAGFNEVFPLFNWYVVETDSTRYKNTGTHVVYDAGGPVDGSPLLRHSPASRRAEIPRSASTWPEPWKTILVPADLRVPGLGLLRQCGLHRLLHRQWSGKQRLEQSSPPAESIRRGSRATAGRASWDRTSFLEFGKKPFAAGENGGIRGHVVYASTRPFDDPALLLQLSWEPLVPNVTINLYQEGTAPDGSTSLKLVDTTKTSSWDDWAQGFRSDGMPNMNCPGQSTADPFYFTLFNQPELPEPRRDAAARTTPSTSATTACTTGISCSRRPTTACTSSPASTGTRSADRQADRNELHRSASPNPRRGIDRLGLRHSRCCRPASTWSKWLCLRATNW